MFTNTQSSPAAKMTSLTPGAVSLTAGFWDDLHRRTRTVTVPSMADLLFDPEVGHAIQNFQIATGDLEGTHEGPPFMDGDLYKWLEAAVVALSFEPDPEVSAKVDAAITVIAAAQRSDGYLHTPTLIRERVEGSAEALADRLHFETYNLGHLMTAGCVHFRTTGRRDLLDVAVRAADYLRGLVANHPEVIARSAICPSHYMGVAELYRTTEDPAYLQLATDLLDLRDKVSTSGLGGDDNQDRVPLHEHTTVTGHAVRATYLYAGVADVVAETGDREMLERLELLWTDLAQTRVHLTGGIGALYDGASPDGAPDQSQITRVHQAFGRPYQLPNTTAHNESCASIGLVMWSWRLLLLTGHGRYADMIELILFNELVASIGDDGASYFYTNPLRQVRDLPYQLRRAGDTAVFPIPDPPASDARLRQEWLSCFCCPPNIARSLAEVPYLIYADKAATADSPAVVWVHQFVNSTATFDVAGTQLTLEQSTDFPISGNISIAVSCPAPVTAEVRVRIPAWAPGAELTVDGESVDARENGYAVIGRTWQGGEAITLTLPMEPRLVVGNRLAEEITNQVALVRGPVVYCFESHDLPGDATIERVLIRRSADVTTSELPVAWSSIPALEVPIEITPATPESLYGEVAMGELEQARAVAIPYAHWANRGPSEMSVWMNLAW